jgi:very-short-patch-repair endonuclease
VNRDIDLIASRQHSLITTGQLLAAGFSSRQIAHLHQKGALDAIRPRVYRLAGGPVSWIQTVHAAVLASAAAAVVSHGTAAALWELRHADRDHCGLHLTAGRQLRLVGVTGHTGSFGRNEKTVYLGVPVTSPERTLMDLAGTLSVNRLGQCLDDALRRHLVNLERLRRLVTLAASGGRRRLGPIHQLLAERVTGYQPGGSDWEQQMNDLWDRLGLESGVRQYRVRLNGRTYFLDRAIPELKIGAEYNGHEHHHLRSDRDHDAQRAAELSAAGWHIITFTAATRPETMRGAVQRIVEDRRSWRASA